MSPQEKSAVPWLMVCAWNCQNAREIHCQLAGTQKVTWVDLHKMYRLFYNNPSKTVKIPFCVCIISPESACRGKCFSAEKCISAKRFPYEMCLIEAQSQSVMTSFHVAERANSVHVGGGIFQSALAERFLLHGCWLENESELLSLVELKYSIVNLRGTWRIQHQVINALLITVGNYYDAIISNGHINIPYSLSSNIQIVLLTLPPGI